MNDILHPEEFGSPAEATQAPPDVLHPENFGAEENWNDILHQQATGNLNATMGVNPDHAAKAADVSKQLDIPQPAVASDLETYAHIANTKINRENIQANPKLMAWLAKNPLNAQVASDDIPNLSFLEKVMQSLDVGTQSALTQNEIGRLGTDLQMRTLVGADTSAIKARLDYLQGEDTPQLHGGFKLAQDFTGLIVGQANSLYHAVPEMAAGAAIGAAMSPEIAGAGAIPGGVSGLVIGWKLDQSRIAAGQAYLQMNNVIGRDGQPLSESSKLLASTMVGVGTYALFSLGGKGAKGIVNEVGAKLNQEAALQAVMRPTVQTMLADAAKTMTKGALMFAGFNGAMTVLNQTSIETAKLLSTGTFDSVFNSPELRAQYVSQLADSIEQGLKMGLILGGIGAGVGIRGDIRRVQEANQNAAALTNLMEGTEKSKLHSRSMQMFEDFMSGQTKGKPAENIFIPAEKIEALYQEFGITPETKDSLFGFVPNMREQVIEAKQTHGDVVIPTADFISRLSGSDIGKRLIPDVRMTPDGLSLNEAKAFQGQIKELQKQYAQLATDVEDHGRQVYQDVLQKVKAAGYSEKDAQIYAGLYAARYSARAERKGTTAVEEYQRKPLAIQTATSGVKAGPLPTLRLDKRSAQRGEATPGYFSMEDLASYYGSEGVLPPGKEVPSVLPQTRHHALTTEEMIQEAKARITEIEKEHQTKLFQGMTPEERQSYFDHIDGLDKPLNITDEQWKKLEKMEPPSWRKLYQDNESRDALTTRGVLAARRDKNISPSDLSRVLGIPYGRGERLIKQLEEEGFVKATGKGQYETTEKINTANILYQSAFHGSPYKFDKFTLDHMGKGEGAQAFGWGLYFAGNKEVAEYYRKTLANQEVYFNGKKIITVANKIKDSQRNAIYTALKKDTDIAAYLNDKAENYGTMNSILDDYVRFGGDIDQVKKLVSEYSDYFRPRYEEALKLFEKDGASKFVTKHKGQLYEANIPESHKMLDWDKPLSEQSSDVKEAVNKVVPGLIDALPRYKELTKKSTELMQAGKLSTPEWDAVVSEQREIRKQMGDAIGGLGEDFYKWLSEKLGGQEQASRALHDAGIGGIQYLDQSSRAKGEGTHNYVVFDDKAVEILKTFYQSADAADAAGQSAMLSAEASKRGYKTVDEFVEKEPDEFLRLAQDWRATHEQSTGGEHRAEIQLGENGNLINLFKDANMSSLAHESGHLWLNELSEDAGLPNAPKELVADFDTFLKWSGFDGDKAKWDASSFEVQRPYHEKFARAFEQYLMEGKAPTQGLRAVFARFKDWLVKIYKSLDALGAQINDEIRGVFDRLIATDEQINVAQHKVGGDRTVFESTGMGKTEAAAYAKAIEQANAAAHDELMAQAMADVRKRYSAESREQRAAVSEAVAEEIDQRADMKAYRFLLSGDGKNMGLPGLEAFKLNEEAAQRIAWGSRDPDSPVVKQLPKGILSKDGVMPDEAAEIFGFKSGDALIKALQALELQRTTKNLETGARDSIRQVQIDNEVERRMAEKYPKPTEEEMQQEALDAVHSKERDHVLAIEARVLARMAGKIQIDVEDIRGWARETLDKKTVADATAVNTFARGEQKAARLAQKALLAEKYDEALQYKRQQILNNELYKEASKALEEVTKAQKLFDRLTRKSTFKGVDQEFTDQIQDLLGRFGFDSGRGEELQRTKGGTLEEFVNRKSAENGLDISIDPALYTLSSKDMREMTMPEFRALDEAVRSMYALGREEKQIVVGGQKVEFDSVINQMVTAIRALGEREKSNFYDPTDAGKWAAFKEKTFGTLRAIDASLLKPEALFDQIDRADPFGIMNTAVYRRMKDAQHNRDLWQQAAATDMRNLVKSMPKGWEKSMRKTIPEDPNLINPETGGPIKLTRQRMIAMALNWGNEGNRTKLADGYGWDKAAIKAYLDRNMSKEEWDFVQKIWDMFASHTAELDALQKRVTGVGLKLVQADAFDTPHGHLEGGYYPIVYDANKSERAAQLQEKNTQAMFPGNYTRATTPKGNTIARVEGVKRPIELNLDIAPWKIGQTLHDLAFREAIMDADRLLSHKDVRRAMKDVFGKEYANLLRPWLKYVANSRNIDDSAIGWMDKAVNAARANTVIVGIGFRATTLFKHTLTALSNSFGELGPKWMLKGTAEFYGPGMSEKWDFIKEKSPEMAFRLKHYDKDLNAQYDRLLKDSTYTNFQKNAQYFGHIAISYFDLGSAVPTWLGAYRKALHEGMADADAVYYADKTVRNAHGAQGLTDTSAIQHATGVARLTNMFYGFFNHIYNRQRTMFIQGKEGIQALGHGEFRTAGKDFAGVLGKSFYYIVIPALVEAMATNHGPDENKDEGWGEWAAHAILAEIPAGIPILRDIAKAAIEGHDYEMSPIAKLVETMIESGKDVSKIAAGEEAPRAGQHVVTALGYLFGLPTAAPFTAGKFLWDYNDGEVDPQSVNEWINGLTKGGTE